MAAKGVEAADDLVGQFAGRTEDRARGTPVWPDFLSARQLRIGKAKAAVLPVPVRAMPMMSRPAIAGGIASPWIGVDGCFSSATARSNGAARPKSLNVIDWLHFKNEQQAIPSGMAAVVARTNQTSRVIRVVRDWISKKGELRPSGPRTCNSPTAL